MKSNTKFTIFSEKPLVVMVSIVTLLLQLISFATTWSGSRVYLEGVFPYASLLFAIAIQSIAYFFSNSMRRKASVLKGVAMFLALCCSTYYSYIGIYNSVNSPIGYLQKGYTKIEKNLTEIYSQNTKQNIGMAKETVNTATSDIVSYYTQLLIQKEELNNCRAALAKSKTTISSGLRAPKESEYEKYEDYVAAYNAYVAGRAQGSSTEKGASRQDVLAAYGFTTMEELQRAEAENVSAYQTLYAALGMEETDDFSREIYGLNNLLTDAIEQAGYGKELDGDTSNSLMRLLQAARICGGREASLAEITGAVAKTASLSREPLMKSYEELVDSLADGKVMDANLMELKSSMDWQILSALMKLQMTDFEVEYLLTDLYLLPIQALRDSSINLTAFFCLGMASLIDILSVVFAVSLRGKRPLWKKRTLFFTGMQDYSSQICASLPDGLGFGQAITAFLIHFTPSPETERDGYMMRARMTDLTEYYPLVALLCQLNLAKAVSEEEEYLLLRARFVLWVNDMLYEESNTEQEALA